MTADLQIIFFSIYLIFILLSAYFSGLLFVSFRVKRRVIENIQTINNDERTSSQHIIQKSQSMVEKKKENIAKLSQNLIGENDFPFTMKKPEYKSGGKEENREKKKKKL